MTTTRAARAGVGTWTPAELGVLLQAVEPVAGPSAPAGSVTVRGRAVEVVPCSDGTGPRHGDLLACGRLVARLETAIRSVGWEPRREVAEDAAAEPLVTVEAVRRRPAIPLALARHRVDRRLREGFPAGRDRPELSQVVDVVRGASTTRSWLVLSNGPTQDGAPAWHGPGAPIPEAEGVDLPWRWDPVLAVCTHGDGARDHVAGGIASHRAVVTAGLRGLRADVHTAPLDGAADRAAWGRRLDPRAGCVQALVHLYP
ncbi:hypothetical protein [Actinomycetospora sp. TBRC 11914]|uniref:hypothetical protein n=1 Tax=Actinomycetospora sp. TBRC 11914 TaxID=2729387 RepID=UPI00145D2CB2|nr:hypothetical protein [Actinomycetospora sp. TBRC 11914]NMO89457.1 hypothetical protein [Actinomycetospora sp. TBRC 11914]